MSAEWRHAAACAGMPPSRFEVPPGPRKRIVVATALSVCQSCPVIDECRAYAMSYPDPLEGLVAGGLAPAERDRRRGTNPRTRQEPPLIVNRSAPFHKLVELADAITHGEAV